MRGRSAKNERTGYRLRLAGMAGGVGAATVVAIMALSAVASAGVASPAAFRGATYSPSLYRSQSGCSTATGILPHWAKLTGLGKLANGATAKTCSAALGGRNTYSDGYSDGSLSVMVPVHFPTGSGGINVTWAITLAGTTSGAGTGTCPSTTTHYSYNYGYTWFNATYTSAYCTAEGSLSMYGYSYVTNLSGGFGAYASNYWSAPYNTSGLYVDMYTDTYNYSNSSYWAYNSSYSGNYSYNYGPSGSLSGTYTPTWFINGTFSKADKYAVTTYLYLDASAYVHGFTGAHASAIGNAASGGNKVVLGALHPW